MKKMIIIISILLISMEISAQEPVTIKTDNYTFSNNIGRSSTVMENGDLVTNTVTYLKEGYATTTYHDFEDKLATPLILEFPEDILGGIIVAQDEEQDISLIKLLRKPKGSIEIEIADLTSKKNITIIGYPYRYSEKSHVKGIRTVIQGGEIFLETKNRGFIDFNVVSGFSGSGIFNEQGQLLGMITGSVANNTKNQTNIRNLGGEPRALMSMFVKSTYLNSLIVNQMSY